MNAESGSALQKASFVLLVFIAAALAYLIVRERIRSQPEPEPSSAHVESTKRSNELTVASWNPKEMRSSFAPLRPRVETNVQRVTGVPLGAPLNSQTPVTRELPSALISSPTATARNVPVPAPAAFQAGGGEAVGEKTASVVGRVTLRGTPPPEKQINLDPTCARLHPGPMFTRHFVVGRDSGLGNVFVYVKSGAPKDESKPDSVPVLEMVACGFQPYILGVRAGQPFSLRNASPILENVHFSPRPGSGNREGNFGMPVRGMSITKVFDYPEVFIRTKCDVHPWMFAYIAVVEHRWFTVTDNHGNFALPPGLPPGQYTLAAVHLKAGEALQEINVSDGVPPVTSFTLDVPKALAQIP